MSLVFENMIVNVIALFVFIILLASIIDICGRVDPKISITSGNCKPILAGLPTKSLTNELVSLTTHTPQSFGIACMRTQSEFGKGHILSDGEIGTSGLSIREGLMAIFSQEFLHIGNLWNLWKLCTGQRTDTKLLNLSCHHLYEVIQFVMTQLFELVLSMIRTIQFAWYRPWWTMNSLADFWMMSVHPFLTSLQSTKRIFTLFVLRCWIGIIILEKYSLVSLGFFMLLILSLRKTKESCFDKMQGWFGPRHLKRGRPVSEHRRLSLESADSIMAGGIVDGIPPRRSMLKELNACITSKLIGGWECLWRGAISSTTTESNDGIQGERTEEPRDAGEDPEVQGEKRKKNKKKDDSAMVIDGSEGRKTKGTKRKGTGKPDDDDPSDDSDDEGHNDKGNKNDDEDDMVRLARESEILRAFLQLALKKEIVGSTTLMGTMNNVSVIWNFVAIQLISEDQVVRSGYVMYLISSNNKSNDLRLDGKWLHPLMWTLIQIGNKTLIVPSFLLSEVLQQTRLARKRGNLSFDTLSAVNPLLEQSDDWGAMLREHAERTELEVPMSKMSLNPGVAADANPLKTKTRTSKKDKEDVSEVTDESSSERTGRSIERDESDKLFSATRRSKSLTKNERRGMPNLPDSMMVCKKLEDKWSRNSPIIFEEFCQNVWEEIVRYGRGPRTWLSVIQARLAPNELRTLSPLFAFSGSYRCRSSDTTIRSLARPKPVEWVRCASVLIYDSLIANTRKAEADRLKMEPGQRIVPFIESLERVYNIVGIHRRWSRHEARRHVIDRMTIETFGTEFMSLYLSYFPKPPSPLDYGKLKDKCKIIAARIELTSDTNIGNPGLKTFVVQEKFVTSNGKSEKKEEGKSTSKETNLSSKDIAKAVELGVAAAMKAMANKTMVTTEKGKQKAQPKPKEVPLFDCKWCDKQHKHKEDQCWYISQRSARKGSLPRFEQEC